MSGKTRMSYGKWGKMEQQLRWQHAACPVASARLLLNFFISREIQYRFVICDMWSLFVSSSCSGCLVRSPLPPNPALENLRGGRGEGGPGPPGPSLGRRFSVANRRATRTFSSPNCKIRAKKPRLHGTPLDTYTHPPAPPHHPMATDYLYTVHDSSDRMFNKNVDLRSVSYNSLFRHILNSPSY